ncbi:MAG: tetratricopeptide repeat protein [Chitinophagaceae bacterium]|nr:tetratricopeptide repeat protein [Chitinophagaceae bacterium]
MMYRLSAIIACCILLCICSRAQAPAGSNSAYTKASRAIALSFSNADSSIVLANDALQLAIKDKSNYGIARADVNLAEVLMNQNRLSDALNCLIEANAALAKQNDKNLQDIVNWKLGIVYKHSGDYTKALPYFKEAMEGFASRQNDSLYLNAGLSFSALYRATEQPDSSLLVLQKCSELFVNRLNDNYQLAAVEEGLGETYLDMKQWDMSLSHFKTSKAIFTQLKSAPDVAYQLFCIGRVLSRMKQYREAEPYFFQAYKISDSLKIYKYLFRTSYELVNMYAQEGNWKDAYRYTIKKNEWSDSVNLKNELLKMNALEAKYESQKKQHEIDLLLSQQQMIKWWLFSGALALAIAGLFIWLFYVRRKVKEEKILNYFATSLYNQNTVEDVFWDIAKNCVSKLQLEDCVIYGFNEAKNILVQKAAYGPKNPGGYQISHYIEIPVGKGIVGHVAQTREPEIVNDVSKDSRYITDDMARSAEIAVPILVEGKLIGIIDSEHSQKGFYTKRHLRIFQKIADICAKKITPQLIEEGLRKDIARDLHDDIGSALTSISIASKIALQKKEQGNSVSEYLQKINDQSGAMMESMSDIIWAIKPGNNDLESTFSHMKEFASELCEPLGITMQFDAPDKLNAVTITADIRKNIFLIYKEVVNNAVKYSNCSVIITKFEQLPGKQVSMTVADNGNGFDKAVIKPGNGLINMQERARQINGTLTISSASPGTTVTLVFPV